AWVARPLLAAALPRRLRIARARRGPTWAPPWAGPVLRAAAREQSERSIARALRGAGAADRFDTLARGAHRIHLAWLRHQEQVGGGLERRDPFLAPDLARLVTAWPPALLLHGGVRRGLFREACRGLLPESLRTREDKASFEPAFERCFVASDGPRRMRGYADLAALADLGLVEPAPFRSAFERFVAAPSVGWEDVWPALAIESFLRRRAEGHA
ncbi:MAG: Asparagine synthetase, partial [Labilithrix sp.]|nr:Asparagine synthetase [Labilithrix sp.]